MDGQRGAEAWVPTTRERRARGRFRTKLRVSGEVSELFEKKKKREKARQIRRRKEKTRRDGRSRSEHSLELEPFQH